MCIYRIIVYFLFQTLLLFECLTVHSQESRKDTVYIKFGEIIVLKDSAIVPSSDTTVLLTYGKKFKIKANPYFKSQNFYDSLKIKSRVLEFSIFSYSKLACFFIIIGFNFNLKLFSIILSVKLVITLDICINI